MCSGETMIDGLQNRNTKHNKGKWWRCKSVSPYYVVVVDKYWQL